MVGCHEEVGEVAHPIRSVCGFVLILGVMVMSRPAVAAQAEYLDGPEDLTWFLAISDTHVGAEELIYGDKDLERLEWACTTLVAAVDPVFMVNAGDLTDATAWGLVPTGQVEAEWIEYAETVAGNGMDPGFYFDLPGNHDHYGDGDLDHYTTWSVSGGADGATNHAWTFSAGVTDCLAMGLATCASNGAPAPFDDTSLDDDDQAFIADTLAAHPDEDLVLVFGHHPVGQLGEGKEVLEDLIAQDRVGLYLYGHTHDWDEFWDLGTLHINISSLTKSENKNVAVVAIDGGGVSVRVFDVQDWPQILVTAPLDRDLGGGHLAAYKIPWYLEDAPVRALAFDPAGIETVEWSLDGEIWTPMDPLEEHVYQGSFDATVLSEYPQTLRVRAWSAGGGEPALHEVRILADPYAEPPDPPDPGADEPPEVVEADSWEEDAGGGIEEIVEEVIEAPDTITSDAEEPDAAEVAATNIDVAGSGETAGDDNDSGTSEPVYPVSEGSGSRGCSATDGGNQPVALLLFLLALILLRIRRFTAVP